MLKNNWSEFEYSKFKILLNNKKANRIFDVLNRKKIYDNLPPISVELHLTDRCNLNCHWCTDKILRKNKASNDKNLIFNLFNYFKKHNIGVTIEGGGEPSLHEDFEEIVKYGSNCGLSLGLISNGVKNFSHLIKYFKWVRISLDATNEKEYETEKGINKFNEVISNLSEFSNSRDPFKTHLGIGYVITKNNFVNIIDFVKKIDSFGVDYIYLRPVEESLKICPDISTLFNLKKKLINLSKYTRIKSLLSINERLIKNNDNLPCICHSLSCIIQANGEVAMCEKRRHDKIILGNLKKDSFKKIWNSENRKKISEKLLIPDNQIGCDVCRITSFNRIFYDVNNIHTKEFI